MVGSDNVVYVGTKKGLVLVLFISVILLAGSRGDGKQRCISIPASD